jgi:hypothetical protein
MRRLASRKTLAATAAVLAVGGGGAGLAAAQGSSSAPGGFFDAVAKHLGISSDELQDATKAAAIDQVNAALEEGKITKEQADELKSRIESGELPPFFGPGPFGGFGFQDHVHGPRHNLSAAADYLGLTVAELFDRLDGQSLADVAKAEGKSVDGLKQAIIAEAEKDLGQAVDDEDLTREQADAILDRLHSGIDDFVNAEFRVRRSERLFPGAGHELRWHAWLGRPFA